jgi:S1-C subfamily serine protease
VSIRVTSTGTDVFQQEVTQEGAGTGFVASADGLIYTNAHVVDGADDVQVTLADGTTHDGQVIGVDTTDDLAVVKIDVSGLTPLPIGSSADMEVGDPVVAVGNALALPGGPTATQGIVSALNRSIDTDNGEHLARLIQTDAAINPGNSGGPLVNSAGEVIGINTAGASNAENVGFAISLDAAKPILDQLAQGKTVVRPFLGVQTQTVTPDAAQQSDLGVDHGAYIQAITADSGAELAGLQVGDVIVDIDGTTINTSDDVGTVLRDHKPDDSIKITVHRDGDDVTVTAKLGTREA